MKEIVTSRPASGGSIPIIDNVFQGWSPRGVVRYNRLREKVEAHWVLELFKQLSDMKESDGDEVLEIDEDRQGEVDESGFDEFSDVVMFAAV